MAYLILTTGLCLALLLARLTTGAYFRKHGVHSDADDPQKAELRRKTEHGREISLLRLGGAVERRDLWLENLAMALSLEARRPGTSPAYQPTPEATPLPTVTEIEREISAVNEEIDRHRSDLRRAEGNDAWMP